MQLEGGKHLTKMDSTGEIMNYGCLFDIEKRIREMPETVLGDEKRQQIIDKGSVTLCLKFDGCNIDRLGGQCTHYEMQILQHGNDWDTQHGLDSLCILLGKEGKDVHDEAFGYINPIKDKINEEGGLWFGETLVPVDWTICADMKALLETSLKQGESMSVSVEC